jgi:hypothetical protein
MLSLVLFVAANRYLFQQYLRLRERRKAGAEGTRLVPLYVPIQLYRAALESIAAFFAAQMTAIGKCDQERRRDDRAVHPQPGQPGGDYQGTPADHRQAEALKR